MPAKHHVDTESRIIMTTWEGDAVDTEFIEAIQNYQKEIQVNPEYVAFNEVVDFRDVTSIKLSPKGLKTIGRIAVKTDELKTNSKLALIVTSGIAFNLARIYASYRNLERNSGKEIRIFKNEAEALEWAREGCEA